MAKKNRARNKMLAAQWAEAKAAEEQQLAPPPDFVTKVTDVAAQTTGEYEARQEEQQRNFQGFVDTTTKQFQAQAEALKQQQADIAKQQEALAQQQKYAAPYSEPSASAGSSGYEDQPQVRTAAPEPLALPAEVDWNKVGIGVLVLGLLWYWSR